MVEKNKAFEGRLRDLSVEKIVDYRLGKEIFLCQDVFINGCSGGDVAYNELHKDIEKECMKINRKVSVCLQFNIAKEETKSGFMLDEWKEVMEYCSHLSYIDVCGIMVMGPHTDDKEAIVRVFKQAQELFVLMQGKYPQIQELSMGMSDDYPFALAHGATMIRVGSKLFENV